MPDDTVLIAALSGRALAASAKRAGYRPLVVDCFGDQDLASAHNDNRVLPARMRVGIRGKSLVDALDALHAQSDGPVAGLVLGSGFEDRPGLIRKLANRFPYLGTDADTLAALKDPTVFFPLLDKLGIAHPKTQTDAPANPDGWLKKRIGGSGGLHIKPCTPTAKAGPRTYFQQQVPGQAVSALAIVGKGGTAFALSKQWSAPTPRTPYRYGGAVSHAALSPGQEHTVLEAALAITEAADLKGLTSIDFVIDGPDVFCLEINPRPGATLDVHDDDRGSLFEAHMIACKGGDPAQFLQHRWSSNNAKATAVLYADADPLTIKVDQWPDWVSDRPQPGATVFAGQPLASANAEAATSEEAEQLCLERLAGLKKMLYDSQIGKEHAT